MCDHRRVTTPPPSRCMDCRATVPQQVTDERAVDVSDLGADERAVVRLVVDRLRMGARQYGVLDVAADRRDWGRETYEELIDAAVYRAIGALSRTRGGVPAGGETRPLPNVQPNVQPNVPGIASGNGAENVPVNVQPPASPCPCQSCSSSAGVLAAAGRWAELDRLRKGGSGKGGSGK